uniref:HP domain-containing protein n=1 Tax=Macrostomum lignano TaxID=282301 RepID=A0A1I8F8Y4_9PLAT
MRAFRLPRFYGTDKIEAAVLFKQCTRACQLCVHSGENAIGQESGPVTSQQKLAEAKECTNPLTSLVCMIPNQGTIAPYQKALVCFRFSPRWYKSKRSFHTTEDSPPKQDFALFMYIQLVGTQTDSASPDSHRTQLEVALTGTALPILLQVSPSRGGELRRCPAEHPADAAFTLANQSEDGLPVLFSRSARSPTSMPDQSEVKLSQARELPFGNFDVQLEICILGEVADDRQDPLTRRLDVIHSPVASTRGITPLVANEVGLCTDTRFDELNERPVQPPLAALVAHTNARLHRQHAVSADEGSGGDGKRRKQARIAFPNESSRQPATVGAAPPCSPRVKRHNFVDPDYAYEDSEVERVRQHKQGYADSQRKRTENLIVSQRDRRLKRFENDRDMGMIPAMGMRPVKLGLEDLRPDTPPPEPPNKVFQLLSTKEIQDVKETAANQTAKDGLGAVPMSQKEKEECRMLLRPQELHQVVITPAPSISASSAFVPWSPPRADS